ncbi:hypothetical protein Cfor_02059 [Coptotermes formosanus]|uniref:Uncharacterized protein n=1 Tax=Coptotermes formosanus TaxID=36987 RepID=A0A6L2P9M6_COPFO|nr:hypothetical protein Cfor_02059 [Coptotermes formosanus]
MIEEKVHAWWKLSWKYTTPSILVFIFVTTIAFNSPVMYNGKTYPDWAIAMGWFSALSSMICIPIGIIYTLTKSQGTLYEVSITIHLISQETGTFSSATVRMLDLANMPEISLDSRKVSSQAAAGGLHLRQITLHGRTTC